MDNANLDARNPRERQCAAPQCVCRARHYRRYPVWGVRTAKLVQSVLSRRGHSSSAFARRCSSRIGGAKNAYLSTFNRLSRGG